jgi:hypothetical protein
MYSIGDIIDKLVIENIKIFNIREKLHSTTIEDTEYVELNQKMMLLNDNKTEISKILDDKVDKVVSKEERNRIIKTIKTY